MGDEDNLSTYTLIEELCGVRTSEDRTALWTCHSCSFPLANILQTDYAENIHNCNSDGCCENLSFNPGLQCPDRLNLKGLETHGDICFLDFLRRSVGKKQLGLEYEIEPETVAFCYCHESLFGEYRGNRSKAYSGWEGINTHDDLKHVLRSTIWYKMSEGLVRKGSGKGEKIISGTTEKRFYSRYLKDLEIGVAKHHLRTAVEQANNIVVGFFLMFPSATPTFMQVQTMYMDLITLGIVDHTQPKQLCSLFTEMKNYAAYVKTNFHKKGRYALGIFTYKFKIEALNRIYDIFTYHIVNHPEFREFLDSPALELLGAMGGQTRYLGPPPLWFVKEEESKAWDRLTERHPLNKEIIKDMRQSCRKWLKSVEFETKFDYGGVEDIKDFDFRIPSTGSFTTPSADFGKREDARKIISYYVSKERKYRVYNFRTGTYKERTYETCRMKECLFCHSVQSFINLLSTMKVHNFKHKDKRFNEDLPFDHINCTKFGVVIEPGKPRFLTKGSMEHYLLFAPFCSSLKDMLAEADQSHYDGLKGEEHAWKALLHLGPDGDPNIAYDKEGNRKESLIMKFSDWTEATDRINRVLAASLLHEFFMKANIGDFIMEILIAVILLPIPIQTDSKSGHMFDPVPMGLGYAKLTLHLLQGTISQSAKTAVLNKYGIAITAPVYTFQK